MIGAAARASATRRPRVSDVAGDGVIDTSGGGQRYSAAMGFGQRNYDGTRVADIAAAADVSKARRAAQELPPASPGTRDQGAA